MRSTGKVEALERFRKRWICYNSMNKSKVEWNSRNRHKMCIARIAVSEQGICSWRLLTKGCLVRLSMKKDM